MRQIPRPHNPRLCNAPRGVAGALTFSAQDGRAVNHRFDGHRSKVNVPQENIGEVPGLCILRRTLMTSARALSAGSSRSNFLKPLPGPWPCLRSQLGKPARENM